MSGSRLDQKRLRLAARALMPIARLLERSSLLTPRITAGNPGRFIDDMPRFGEVLDTRAAWRGAR